jgi:hypothetical protein
MSGPNYAARMASTKSRTKTAPKKTALKKTAPKAPRASLGEFIDKFSPAVAKTARAALVKMRARLPGAVELVYDNYNALAIAFSPTEKPRDIVLSIALYPRWVSLFFADASGLPDPHAILKGSGAKFKHVVLERVDVIEDPRVETIIAAAVKRSKVAFDANAKNRIVVQSISAKQRPRRSPSA